MDTNSVILIVPRHLIDPQYVVYLDRLAPPDLVGFFRNTAIARFREETYQDTRHKLKFLADGETALADELLRRLASVGSGQPPAPPPANAGMAAMRARVADLQRQIAPNLAPPAPNQAPQPPTPRPPQNQQERARTPPRNRNRGFEM